MFKFEYETVLDVMEINKEELSKTNFVKYNSIKQIVELKNIPLDFSTKIYKKYSNYRKNISVTSDMIDIEPKHDNCTFYINSLDAFLMYLIEMKKYYYSNSNERILNFELNSEFKEKKALVVEKIINKVNPFLTTDDWIKKNIKGDITINNLPNDSMDREINTLLSTFDNNINPFMNNNDKLLKPIDYLKNIDFSYNLGKYSDFFLRDKNNSAILHYKRSDDFVLYSIYFNNNGIDTHVQHEYNIINSKNVVETLKITELTANDDGKYNDIKYNLSTGSIIDGKQLYIEPSQMHKSRTAIILSAAFEASNKVTLDNMIKENCRSLKKGN